VVEKGEGKNGELIWLWEALTARGVPGDLCALARAIHRYGTGKRVGSVAANLGARVIILHSGAGPSLDVGTSGTHRREVPKFNKVGFISSHDPPCPWPSPKGSLFVTHVPGN
jgi:hypothetical protein